LIRSFREDVKRCFRQGEIKTGLTRTKIIVKALSENTLWIIFLYRISRWVRYGCQVPILRFLLRILCSIFRKPLFFLHGTQIDLDAEIGPGFYIGHYGGIWIGPAKIGSNCNIAHNVTIGIGGKGEFRGIPEIGDNVYIGPGAIIFGKIKLGDNVAIGANAVVSKSMPDNAIVVGNPARIVGYEGSKDLIELQDGDREIFK